jgi:hypothetical protein
MLFYSSLFAREQAVFLFNSCDLEQTGWCSYTKDTIRHTVHVCGWYCSGILASLPPLSHTLTDLLVRSHITPGSQNSSRLRVITSPCLTPSALTPVVISRRTASLSDFIQTAVTQFSWRAHSFRLQLQFRVYELGEYVKRCLHEKGLRNVKIRNYMSSQLSEIKFCLFLSGIKLTRCCSCP